MITSATYPAGIAPALGHLNKQRNSIEIFVEDTTTLNMWRNIVQTFLPANTPFSDPIPLGGRKEVIRECSLDQTDDKRKRLYIIDGDLDQLLGIPLPPLQHLYRLPMYCVENYLIQENAILKVCEVLDVNVSHAEAQSKLDFTGWIDRNSKTFEQLYICYAVAHSLDRQNKTVSYWIGHLSRSAPDHGDLCPHKTYRRVFSIYRNLRKNHSKELVRQRYQEVKERAQNSTILHYVSGKDGLLIQLIERLNRLFGKESQQKIKVQLSQHISPDIDPIFKKRLHEICLDHS